MAQASLQTTVCIVGGGPAGIVLALLLARAGIDVNALATQLQVDGAVAFVKSWTELMQRIKDKSAALATT